VLNYRKKKKKHRFPVKPGMTDTVDSCNRSE